MAFRNTLLAAATILSSATAHMIMDTPVPYSVDKIDNGPISAAQFPCKIQNGFEVSKQNKMAVGEEQPLGFKGSAVHNGGTCQLSVALSQEPNADTVFKVIKTIEGGCPGKNGPSNFTFALPDSIPNGEHTFAWTWMPVSSGGPEYYMNCAPIEVTGGASDESKFSQLPDMLVANLAGKTTCTQVVNTILQVPNPGEVVESDDDATKKAPPTGDCGGSSGGAPPVEHRSSTVAQQEPTPVPSNPGGVFAPGASSGTAPVPSGTAPVSSGIAPVSTTTTLITVTPTPSGSAPSAPTPSGTAPSAPAQPTGGAPAQGGNTCSQNNAILCNGDSQFGICDNGHVVWQQVAAGTTCRNGAIQKRAYNGRIVRHLA
jgi:hypothetical protein